MEAKVVLKTLFLIGRLQCGRYPHGASYLGFPTTTTAEIARLPFSALAYTYKSSLGLLVPPVASCY